MSFVVTMEAGEFLANLRYQGILPGIAKNQGGLLEPEEAEEERLDEKLPYSRTFHVQLEESSSIHYRVTKISEHDEWELTRAWQTDAAGELVSECSLENLHDLENAVTTRKAGKFVFPLRLKGLLPGLLTGEKGTFSEENILPTKYPIFRSFCFRFENKNIDALLHYTVVKTSKTSDWQLQRAWRTNLTGHVLEEYSIEPTS